jgi:hypothetical protein
MVVERTNNEVIIRISTSIDTEELQDLLNFVRYKELVSGIKVAQTEVDKLAEDVNKDWWAKNRKRLVD